MRDSLEESTEKIIKSKNRVQNHGEVFTPKRIVKKMLELPEIREISFDLTSTFLEPAVGEGVFLIEVLNRKLKTVAKSYGDDLNKYENYSLLVLSTLYGIELLEDNAQRCVMNMYQLYYEAYQQQAMRHNVKMKNKVLSSAKLIISSNIAQGNFITRLSSNGNSIILSEWRPTNLSKEVKTIKIQRTEFTLDEILHGVDKDNGERISSVIKEQQLDLFDYYDDDAIITTEEKKLKYSLVNITEIYKEKMEEYHG